MSSNISVSSNFDKTKDDFYDKSFFFLTKIYFKLIGLWPFQSYRTRIIMMTLLWIGQFSVIVPKV